jgi:hypothetical protein
MNERKIKILRKVSEEERKQMSLQARVLLNILEKHQNISNQELESLFSKEMQRLNLN